MANTYNIPILDPAIYEVWFAGQPYGTNIVKNVKQWCESEGAELCFNLGTFNTKTKVSDTYVRSKWKDIAYGHEGDSQLLDIGGGNQCRGYSNGIVNGVVQINRGFGGIAYRCGIGITDRNHIIIAQSNQKVTEATFCQAVNKRVLSQSQHVRLFLMEDGGGSTTEYSAVSKLGFNPANPGGAMRPVPTVVCVRRRIKPVLTRPIYNGCKGDDCGGLQIIFGGIPVDNDYGPTSAKRAKATQAALGMASGLQCGIVSAMTAKLLGYEFKI